MAIRQTFLAGRDANQELGEEPAANQNTPEALAEAFDTGDDGWVVLLVARLMI